MNPHDTDGFSSQRASNRDFQYSHSRSLNKLLNKQSNCQWVKTITWCQCNDLCHRKCIQVLFHSSLPLSSSHLIFLFFWTNLGHVITTTTVPHQATHKSWPGQVVVGGWILVRELPTWDYLHVASFVKGLHLPSPGRVALAAAWVVNVI